MLAKRKGEEPVRVLEPKSIPPTKASIEGENVGCTEAAVLPIKRDRRSPVPIVPRVGAVGMGNEEGMEPKVMGAMGVFTFEEVFDGLEAINGVFEKKLEQKKLGAMVFKFFLTFSHYKLKDSL